MDKFKGFTTNQGTNALMVLTGIFELGKTAIPAAHAEYWSYFCAIVLMVILYLTKGGGHDGVIPAEEYETDESASPEDADFPENATKSDPFVPKKGKLALDELIRKGRKP